MRVRLRFSKLGKIRFTSQRDVARMWERALRRHRFPVAYSAGFTPRPLLSFGLALPTGCESLAEYLDVAVDGSRPEAAELDLAALPSRLTPLLPEGIDVTAAAAAEGEDSLQEAVASCRWVLGLDGTDRAEVARRVAVLLAADRVPVVRQRKGRAATDDLRPSILSLEVAGGAADPDEPDGTVDLVAELATKPRGVRPAELMATLAAAARTADGTVPTAPDDHGGPRLRRACRTNQWIECDGSRREPLSETGGAARRPDHLTPAEERAS